mmetsp:Transcript_19565/g.54401  ORF Transcript_19565/g.54401 Transcript_19565/m.54401 type:complete len:1642 (-) Transcript_19565:436-5361(-)
MAHQPRPRVCLPRHLPMVSAALTLALLFLTRATANTAGGDKLVLQVLKQAYLVPLASSGSGAVSAAPLFATWDAATDPCLDQWAGVGCQPAGGNSSDLRVTSLTLQGNESAYLEGAVLPDISLLSALETLDLSSNNLTEAVPRSFSDLRELQVLNLAGNRLKDSLPSFLGDATNPLLSLVNLSSNEFFGGLPTSWCGSNFRVSVVYNNICGFAPSCQGGQAYPTLQDGWEGTYIKAPGRANNWTCDDTPPECGQYCRVTIDHYLTQTAEIKYEFSGFQDPTSGIARYQVALQNISNGELVVDWYDFDGEELPVVGTNETMYRGEIPVSDKTLQEGKSYAVLIAAENGAGPPLTTVQDSNPTTVTLSSPAAGEAFNSGACVNVMTTTVTDRVEACWDSFSDSSVGLDGFYVQKVDLPMGTASQAKFFPASAQGSRAVLSEEPDVGSEFYIRVQAINRAGVSSEYADSPSISVVSETILLVDESVVSGEEAIVAAVVALSVVIIAGLGLMFVLMQRRYSAQHRSAGKNVEHAAMVRSLMLSLEEATNENGLSGATIRMCKDLAFVTTDLMDSTKMAAASVEGFTQVQDIHDQVMRESISRYRGYEIITEGDAFGVAFRDVFDAVNFCMAVQYRLLEVKWSRAVLKLPSCKEVYDASGNLIFKGPCVRMGIHWATQGTFNQRIHPLTKHRIFAGRSWRIAQELGDSAAGGQVLMTQEAWDIVRTNMGKAQFPVVQQVGLFKFEAANTPIWVYEVKEQLIKPLNRTFTALPRDLQIVDDGWGLNIMTPPVQPGDNIPLTVVALVLKPPEDHMHLDLPPNMSQRLYEQLAVQVMQFRGYVFRVNKRRGYFLVAFSDTLDAVRFCHSFQLMLMFVSWPPEAEPFCRAQVVGPDGRYIFNGPRVAMAINEGTEYDAVALYNTHPHRDHAVDYNGVVVDQVKEISSVVHGGQIVLSQYAWIAVQDRIPGQAQAISLGVHQVSKAMPVSIMLMQVLPGVLTRRQFPKVNTELELEPGYLNSPSPAHEMAIVFVKVMKPAQVLTEERMVLHKQANHHLHSAQTQEELMLSGLDTEFARFMQDEEEALLDQDIEDTPLSPTTPKGGSQSMRRVSGSVSSFPPEAMPNTAVEEPKLLRAYAQGIRQYENALRSTLKRFNGYECKEPEPGKFTLAFSCLEDAVLWGTTLQEELLHLDWPEELLQLEECAEVVINLETGKVINGAEASDPPRAYSDSLHDNTTEPGIWEAAMRTASAPLEIPSQSSTGSTSAPRAPSDKVISIFRGLRVQMGCAYGRVASRKPLNTGRADYFGNLPNTAARVMALAKPGQFLIEGSAPWPTPLFTERGGEIFPIQEGQSFGIKIPDLDKKLEAVKYLLGREDSDGQRIHTSSEQVDPVTGEIIRTAILSQFGFFLLKGLDEPKLMLQASSPLLCKRVFKQNKEKLASAPSGSQHHLQRLFTAKEVTKANLTSRRTTGTGTGDLSGSVGNRNARSGSRSKARRSSGSTTSVSFIGSGSRAMEMAAEFGADSVDLGMLRLGNSAAITAGSRSMHNFMPQMPLELQQRQVETDTATSSPFKMKKKRVTIGGTVSSALRDQFSAAGHLRASLARDSLQMQEHSIPETEAVSPDGRPPPGSASLPSFPVESILGTRTFSD